MRIAIHSGTTMRGRIDEVVAEVRRVADQGLRGYWAPMLTGHDTLAVFAIAGREVPGVELGTAVVPIPLRPAFALAQEVATVQEATGGRLTLGIGPSHEALARDAFGLEWPAPLPTTRRYVAALTDIMSGASAQTVAVGPRPVPPILLGAVNPAMAAMAAELAAGTVTWAAGVRTVADVIAPAARRRVESGGASFRIVVALPVCVTNHASEARELIHRRLGGHDHLPSYQKVLRREGVQAIADLALVGSEGTVVRRLDELEAAGATDFAGHVVAARPADIDRTWALLADQASLTRS
jgi:F420-dependent oxidoreductase-like protein